MSRKGKKKKKVVETIIKNPPKERQNWRKRERERERESIDLFVVDNLERIGERGGNEVRINLYEN